MKKIKKTPVTRSFLENLAKQIYDGKSKKFLKLCNGQLQNDDEKPMHCGLGELYFAMTGHEPEEDNVTEDDVADLALERSPLAGFVEKETEKARKAIAKLHPSIQDTLLNTLDNFEDDDSPAAEFREMIYAIQGVNDVACDNAGDVCSVAAYRERARAVANQLRDAAKLLPA